MSLPPGGFYGPSAGSLARFLTTSAVVLTITRREPSPGTCLWGPQEAGARPHLPGVCPCTRPTGHHSRQLPLGRAGCCLCGRHAEVSVGSRVCLLGRQPGGAHEGQADAQEGLTRGRRMPGRGSRGAGGCPGGVTRGRRTPGRGHEGQADAREGLTRGRWGSRGADRRPGGAHEGQADAREGLTRAVCFLGPAELSPQVTVCALRHLPSRVSESSLDPTSGWSCVISVPPRRHHKSSVIGPVLILHTRRLRRGRPRDACRPRAASSQLHLRCPGSGEASVK